MTLGANVDTKAMDKLNRTANASADLMALRKVQEAYAILTAAEWHIDRPGGNTKDSIQRAKRTLDQAADLLAFGESIPTPNSAPPCEECGRPTVAAGRDHVGTDWRCLECD